MQCTRYMVQFTNYNSNARIYKLHLTIYKLQLTTDNAQYTGYNLTLTMFYVNANTAQLTFCKFPGTVYNLQLATQYLHIPQ